MEYRKCEIKIYEAGGVLIGSYKGSYYIEHEYIGNNQNNQYCKLWSKDYHNNVEIYTRGTIIIEYLD